jgi:hypothetical protein
VSHLYLVYSLAFLGLFSSLSCRTPQNSSASDANTKTINPDSPDIVQIRRENFLKLTGQSFTFEKNQIVHIFPVQAKISTSGGTYCLSFVHKTLYTGMDWFHNLPYTDENTFRLADCSEDNHSTHWYKVDFGPMQNANRPIILTKLAHIKPDFQAEDEPERYEMLTVLYHPPQTPAEKKSSGIANMDGAMENNGAERTFVSFMKRISLNEIQEQGANGIVTMMARRGLDLFQMKEDTVTFHKFQAIMAQDNTGKLISKFQVPDQNKQNDAEHARKNYCLKGVANSGDFIFKEFANSDTSSCVAVAFEPIPQHHTIEIFDKSKPRNH